MFSQPVAIDSIAFKQLFAETSADGKTIYLTLNKAVDDETTIIDPAHFSVLCDGQPITVNSVSQGESSPQILAIKMEEALYFGGIITLSYNGNDIHHSDQTLGIFSGMAVKNNLPFRFTLPMRVQAEDYSYNNGLAAESTSDTGGGLNMGHVNPGDYLEYRVYVPKSANYQIHFRVASIRASSEMLVQIDANGSFETVGSVIIQSTGGWQSWQTRSITGFFPEGRYTLRLFMRSGEFNLNWFQFVITTVDVNTPQLPEIHIYPNPANQYVEYDLGEIDFTGKYLLLYNMYGQAVLRDDILASGSGRVHVGDLPKGIYVVVLRCDKQIYATSRLLINRRE
jgi:endoglucanase